MGQYYRPVNIDKMESLNSHDFGNELKLMEHSYIGNNFMQAVERLLSPDGPWHKCQFCWAGDYMDSGLFVPEGTPEKSDEGYDINLYTLTSENNVAPFEVPDYDNISYDDRQKEIDRLGNEWFETLPKRGRFLVNHSKELCIDLEKVEAEGDWALHPLSLLTCSGNGRGSGDYNEDRDKGFHGEIGSWAGDVISMEYDPMYDVLDTSTYEKLTDEEFEVRYSKYIGHSQEIGMEGFEKEIS